MFWNLGSLLSRSFRWCVVVGNSGVDAKFLDFRMVSLTDDFFFLLSKFCFLLKSIGLFIPINETNSHENLVGFLSKFW